MRGYADWSLFSGWVSGTVAGLRILNHVTIPEASVVWELADAVDAAEPLTRNDAATNQFCRHRTWARAPKMVIMTRRR